MNVLVTGGAGFLGSYVLAALSRAGHSAIAYDVAPPGREAAAITAGTQGRYRTGQITDMGRLFEVCRADGIDAIVHTAGLVGLETSLAQPVTTYQTNVMGMVTVCEAARQLGVRRLVYISSNAAYHQGPGPTLRETDPVFSVTAGNPAGHYGTSKMAAEAVGLAYATFQGVDVIALRITAVYGFGMRSAMFIKPMVENAVLGQPTRFDSGGPMKRDYTHVFDCASAVVRAVEAPVLAAGAQRVLNVAAGHARSAGEVADLVRRLIPGADIAIGDSLTPLQEVNARMRASLDISAARAVLGWAPEWSLEDGIAEYADRFRHHLAAA